MRMAQIEIRAGIETKIKIQPKLRAASKNIKDLDPSERKCLFSDENKVYKIFGYSRTIIQLKSIIT